MFFVIALSRGVLLSVIPLQALSLLGDAQRVSVLFFGVSAAGIVFSVCVPMLIRRMGGNRTFHMSMWAMVVAAPLVAASIVVAFTLGMVFYGFSVAASEVSTNVYVMQRVHRQALSRFEPKRVIAVVVALSIGPWLGVYLESRVAHELPYQIAALFALSSILYFRWLGLARYRLQISIARTSNPVEQLKRFFEQPRLRLVWILSIARSCWWVMFIIYTPIFMALNGKSDLLGAAIVSIGSAWTITVPLWGWLGRRYGLRFLFSLGYGVTSVITLLAFAWADSHLYLTLSLIFAALGATILDGAGNVLFFRAVRPWERSEMTGIFLTYRDLGQLTTPGLFALSLKVFALPSVFFAASLWMLASVFCCRYIPKRM